MPTKYKPSAKALSIPAGLAIAAAISLIITITMSMCIANLINSETITWTQAGYWIMGMLFLASFVGAKTANAVIRRQRIAVTVMAATIYWGILLCITALFFGGNYSSVWETALLILGGSGTAAIISMPKQGKIRKKHTTSPR